MSVNYVNYTNRDGNKFAVKELEEFNAFKNIYDKLFIESKERYLQLERALGSVPTSYEELVEACRENYEAASVLEDVFLTIYGSGDDSKTLLSDVTGKFIYVVEGSMINYDANIDRLSEVDKLYLLNPDLEDYTDIFRHNVSFYVENEFMKG